MCDSEKVLSDFWTIFRFSFQIALFFLVKLDDSLKLQQAQGLFTVYPF